MVIRVILLDPVDGLGQRVELCSMQLEVLARRQMW
jgi:hypothetical protein